jgi:PAS domain S-box-containing protein
MPLTSDAHQAADVVERAEAAADSVELASSFREMLDLLPAAVYITDARGCLTYFNPACETFSGRKPEPGTDQWCVTMKLCYPDGRPMPHYECPMAVALKEGRAMRGEQAIGERPDGTHIWFEAYPTPLRDAEENIVGGINMLVDITELKRVEAVLQKSERELADFFENAAVGLHWVGPDGTILRANQAELDLLGYNRDEYIGRRITEFHADEEVIEDILRKLQTHATLKGYEARLKCKDGTIKHVRIDSNVLWEGDRFIHTRCFTRDVTAQKQAEAERASLLARESDARKEAEALNEVACAVSRLDLEIVVQKATDAATELTGAKFGAFFYNVTDEKGESYLLYAFSGAPREAFEEFGLPRNTAIFSPTFRGEGIVRIADVLADPRYGKNPPHRSMPPGHLPVRSYLAVPVVSSSGEVLGGLFFAHPETDVFTERAERIAQRIAVHAAIAMDNARLFNDAQQEIAERKRIEEALRQRDRQFAGIFDQTTGGIAQTNLDGRFLLVNDRFCGMVGRSREELLDLRMQDVTHPDDLPGNADKFRALVAENGPNFVIEKRYVRPDGSTVWVHNDVAAIRDDHGCVRYVVAAVTDVTERKQAEEQLRRSAEELARFNRAAVGRELRMIDLKKEINELRERLGETPAYPLQFEKEADANDG